jgi:hypothetical protein
LPLCQLEARPTRADAFAEALAVEVLWARELAMGKTTKEAARIKDVRWRIASMLPERGAKSLGILSKDAT